MKNKFIYLLLTTLLCNTWQAYGQAGQACTGGQTVLFYDLSTGINAGGQQIPVGQMEDSWKVAVPNPNWTASSGPYLDLYCGNGSPMYGPLQHNTNVAWLSPSIASNSSGASGLSQPGFYRYKMQFNVPAYCAAQSAIITFNTILSDDVINNIWVNTTLHSGVAYGSIMTSNSVITLNTNEIIPGAVNEIVIEVFNNDAWTGMEISGNLTIQTNGFFDMELKDKNGNVKSEFCVGEDIFLFELGHAINVGAHSVSLFQVNGTSVIPISQESIGHTQFWYNVKDMFPQPVTPGTYSVVLNTVASCNGVIAQLHGSRVFTYVCCGVPDASFDLNSGSGKLKGSSIVSGMHDWKIYPVSRFDGNVTTGPLAGTFNQPEFSLNGAESCYYIKHTVTSGCGSACASQRFCNFSCTDKACNLTAPAELCFNAAAHQLSWGSVTGSSSYVIEFLLNDPSCCPGNSSPLSSTSMVMSTTVQGTSYGFEDLPDLLSNCFSWKVYAQCPDGSVSVPSFKCSAEGCQSNGGSSGGIPLGRTLPGAASKPTKAIADYDNTTVSMFPNPAQENVSIDVMTTYDTGLNINIYDGTGRLVKTFKNIKTQERRSSTQWNTGLMDKGMYLVKVSTADGWVITKRLVIE